MATPCSSHCLQARFSRLPLPCSTGWLELQHFALVIADHFRFRAALSAYALLAVQATIFSTRLRTAEKVCRPGRARRFRFFSPSGAGNLSRSLSA